MWSARRWGSRLGSGRPSRRAVSSCRRALRNICKWLYFIGCSGSFDSARSARSSPLCISPSRAVRSACVRAPTTIAWALLPRTWAKRKSMLMRTTVRQRRSPRNPVTCMAAAAAWMPAPRAPRFSCIPRHPLVSGGQPLRGLLRIVRLPIPLERPGRLTSCPILTAPRQFRAERDGRAHDGAARARTSTNVRFQWIRVRAGVHGRLVQSARLRP